MAVHVVNTVGSITVLGELGKVLELPVTMPLATPLYAASNGGTTPAD